jgi:DNA-binding SARP family transcriptional activator
MWALDRDGRPADALAAYRRIARLLADDLGLDPGPGLRRMSARISMSAGASLV